MYLTKMHGIGNSYLILQDLNGMYAEEPGYGLLGKALSDKSYGIGSDGLLVVAKGNIAETWMRVINPDGSEAEMCGNGIRMFARYVHERMVRPSGVVEVGGADGGKIVRPRINYDKTVMVDMGQGIVSEEKIISLPAAGSYFPASVLGYQVDVGNPHFVVFVDAEEVAKQRAKTLGHAIENHEAFQPARTNVEFAYPRSREELDVHVWERGAGLTLACGTGACATAFAAYKTGRTDKNVVVHLPGGPLAISISPDDSIGMTGPAEYIADIQIEEPRLEAMLNHFRQ